MNSVIPMQMCGMFQIRNATFWAIVVMRVYIRVRFIYMSCRIPRCSVLIVAGAADGTGHTWNRYFSRWDGEKLVEYGGLAISEEQLRKAKNADRILDDVKIYGKIQSIYYRANDMVFINLSDGLLNRNVALELAGDTLKYFDYEKPGTGAETDLEKATNDGIIYESVTSCVMYPDKYPLGGAEDAREKYAKISYMLDEPDELPAKLYEGDGFSISVPDDWEIIDDAAVLEESVRMRATAPEAPVFSIWVACYEGQQAGCAGEYAGDKVEFLSRSYPRSLK